MKPIKLIVKTNSEKYPIIIGRNLISKLSLLNSSEYENEFKYCMPKNIKENRIILILFI